MTDPESRAAAAARERRRWELIAQLENGGDEKAILAEMTQLHEADELYVSRLINEVEVNNALKTGELTARYEAMSHALEATLPADHPLRLAFERLFAAFELDEPIGEELFADLEELGLPRDAVEEMRDLNEQRKELQRQKRALNDDDGNS